MDTKNYINRLLIILLISVIACFGLYWLPEEIGGFKIKRVDLLSNIRVTPQADSPDSLQHKSELQDTVFAENIIPGDSIIPKENAQEYRIQDSIRLAYRDSLFNALHPKQDDSPSGRIEDYSPGHAGLQHFFTALQNRRHLKRPVRVAFMGDSFIEGDILVSDFREIMQQQFGGHGVGFVPITALSEQHRISIKQKATGWIRKSLPKEVDYPHIFSGLFFQTAGNTATLSFDIPDYFPSLKPVSSVKFLYAQNDSTQLTFISPGIDTLTQLLPPTSSIRQFVASGIFTEGQFIFTQPKGFGAYGLVLEDNKGICVDNFSLRGNLGFMFEQLTEENCRQFREIRPYDLIILQYGLNVLSSDLFQYDWYQNRMIRIIRRIKELFPESDILLMGVSDRASLQNGEYKTMPELFHLLQTQRQIARQTGIVFWDVFEAMGGEGSMSRYARNNWASKDYTHIRFRGGKEIAKALTQALMTEKDFYDQVEPGDPQETE